jgi:two-component system cell cycle sensor histidine kinase/response regulator CckA
MIIGAGSELQIDILIGAAVVMLALISVFLARHLVRQFRIDERQRKRLLARAKAAEKKYREIFDNAIEGIFQSTVDGRYITANLALARIFGYESPEDLIHGVLSIQEDLYASSDVRAELILQLANQDIAAGHVSEMVRKDGRSIWIRQNVRAVRDQEGNLQYLEGSVVDITGEWWAERRRMILYETARALGESQTVAEARPVIVGSICRILEWGLGVVWDVNRETGLLHGTEVWYNPDVDIEAFDEAVGRSPLRRGVGLAGRVLESGESEWLMLPLHYEQIEDHHARVASECGMRSAFCLPVPVEDEVVHVLEFFSPKASQPDAELMSLLTSVGAQMGVLIERKRSEEALRESEARKAAILESALDCIITFDHEGKIIEFNSAAELTFGYRREEAIGREIAELIFPKRLRGTYRKALAVHGATSSERSAGGRTEVIAMRSDKSEFPVEFSLSRISTPEGDPFFTAYIRDITVRKRAESVRSELAAVVECSNDAIIGMTLSGVIVSWNAGARLIYGYEAEEVIGRHVYLLFPPDRMDELPPTLAAARRGQSVTGLETERLRKDGRKIFVSLTESPIISENGSITGVSSIARDVTDHRRLEEQLRQSQKMEAVGRLAGGIAHDFNNVLTAILGFSDLMIAHVDENHAIRRHLSEIRRSAEFATSLTRQLLAFSRRQTLELKILSLNEIVERIQKMLKRLIGEDVHVMTVLNPGIGKVKADPGQIEQVILNLAVNARDAMPDGGVLTIETSNELILREAIEVGSDLPPGDYVRLSISDTGTGMTDEVMKHIFEPFFTTKEAGKGTGLGLATCYGIVKQSGGYITVDSAPGEGCTFCIFLPRVAESDEEPQSRDEFRTLPRGRERVLIVEDEVTVRCLTAAILRRLGYFVLEAKDGNEARELICREDGNLDLVVADVVLPHSSARDLKDWIERSFEHLKVLFTSGYVEEIVYRQNGISRDDPFLQKPFTSADLARKVRDLLEVGHS